MRNKKKLNIAIIGLGNIGSFLFKYLKKNKNILAKKPMSYRMFYLSLLEIIKEKDPLVSTNLCG